MTFRPVRLATPEDALFTSVAGYMGWLMWAIGAGTALGAPIGFFIAGLPLIGGAGYLLFRYYSRS